MSELIIDSFAGGGGASTGILWVTGRHPDIAINHDEAAIACHERNHPTTRHYREDVWAVEPVEACAGRSVGLAWFSPDCTHFSRAKGGAPRSSKVRGLAWVVLRWARAVRPRVIVLENVEEFTTWGPLDETGQPCKERAGETFGRWHQELEDLGYVVEYRSLHAHHYGAPTSRKRLFLIARCDGKPIVWPTPTHDESNYRTAAECIDWSIPAPSIFGRKRPLSDTTMRRIAAGVQRFVVGAPTPYGAAVLAIDHKSSGASAVWPIDVPLNTITTKARHCVLVARTDGDGCADTVGAFLLAYYGSEAGRAGDTLEQPLRTIVTKDRFGLVVTSHREQRIVDIGMRMLQPHELAAAQGFPPDYDLGDLSKRDQVRLIGNSVCPHVAEAIVRANYVEGK